MEVLYKLGGQNIYSFLFLKISREIDTKRFTFITWTNQFTINECSYFSKNKQKINTAIISKTFFGKKNPKKFFPSLKLPIGLIISPNYGSPSLGFSHYSRKSSAGKQAVCVCFLTAALIRPLWVRLIGPVIRDAALPPSPERWITSHRRLLRFQDKWTEGESITPQEGEGGRTEYLAEILMRAQK